LRINGVDYPLSGFLLREYIFILILVSVISFFMLWDDAPFKLR